MGFAKNEIQFETKKCDASVHGKISMATSSTSSGNNEKYHLQKFEIVFSKLFNVFWKIHQHLLHDARQPYAFLLQFLLLLNADFLEERY